MRLPPLGVRALSLLLSLTAAPAAASCHKPSRASFDSWKAYTGCEAARLADGFLDRNPRLRRFGPVDLGAAAEGEAEAGFERRRASFHALPEGRRLAALERWKKSELDAVTGQLEAEEPSVRRDRRASTEYAPVLASVGPLAALGALALGSAAGRPPSAPSRRSPPPRAPAVPRKGAGATTPPPATAPAPSAPPAAAKGELDLREATILNNPANLAGWPITTRITRLELRPDGIHVEFSKRDGPGSWPDITPPGWDGPLQYTLGMALKIGGRWYASAPIQFWRGLDASGGPPREYAKNWFYDRSRWGPMTGHQPAAGEAIGIFIVAGNVRNITDGGSQSPVKERTNVVVVAMPGPGGASFRF